MMRTMRENTKVILWVVVVAFVVTIFAVWGLDLRTGQQVGDPNVIGEVNGIPITREQYQAFYEMLAGQFRSASSTQSLTYAQEEFIANQAWDNLVLSILTDHEIQKLGIKVSNQEIVSFLRDSPPPEIRQYFLDDEGNFDNESYQAALNNPEIDWTNLEQLARERIPRLKLQNYLSAQVHVSEAEVMQSYREENTEMKIEYVKFPMGETDIGDYSPTDDEVKEYYNSHQDEFSVPAKARLDVIQIDFEPSAADIEDAEYTARRVQEQILAGEDFGVLAGTYSEAPTSHVDGNTGFIRKGQREDSYFEALDQMEPGDVSDPVAGESGYYVLKLIEKRTEESEEAEYSAQEILIKSALSRQTTDSLYALVNDLRAKAVEIGLEEAAAERQFEMLTTDPFTEDAPIGQLGFVPALNRFAFANDVGVVSPVLRDENHLYVARVVDRIPEGVTPAADVDESIRQTLISEKRKDLTHLDAKAFYQKAKIAGFEEAVKTYEVFVQEADTFRVVDNLPDFGPNSAVAQAALAVESGELSPPIEWGGSFVIIRVLEKSEFDGADYETKFPALRNRIEGQKIQAYVAYWYERLREQSQVEDYRGRVY